MSKFKFLFDQSILADKVQNFFANWLRLAVFKHEKHEKRCKNSEQSLSGWRFVWLMLIWLIKMLFKTDVVKLVKLILSIINSESAWLLLERRKYNVLCANSNLHTSSRWSDWSVKVFQNEKSLRKKFFGMNSSWEPYCFCYQMKLTVLVQRTVVVSEGFQFEISSKSAIGGWSEL